MAEPRFQECETCAAKPGAPILCAGCLNNRTVINDLLARRRSGRVIAKKVKVRAPLTRPSGKFMGKQKREAKPE